MKQRLNILLACIALGISASTDSLAQMQVVSISPSFNQIAPNTQPAISVTFNQPLDSTSVTPISFAVYGERSGYKAGRFSYSIDRRSVSFASSTPYNPGERVRVMLTRSIRSQSGDTLRGFSWTFRIPSARRNEFHFADAVVYGGGGFSVQCVDLNNDGHPDIVSSSGVIRLNNGSGEFNTVWTLPDADGWEKIVVDDFNRDGIPDVLYAGSNGLKLGIGDGQGNFSIQTRPFWFFNYVTGDFNSDGYPDIAGIVREGGDTRRWGISLNNGSGSFIDTVVIGSIPSGWLQTMEAFDVDNDGHLDILCAGWLIDSTGEDGIIVWKGNGDGSFQNPQVYASSEFFWFPEQLYSSDFSNNGFADIAVFGYSGNVSLNLGGTFGTDTSSTRNFWGGEFQGAMTGGDFNGDGWIDLLVSGFWFIPWDTSNYRGYAIRFNCPGVFRDCSPFGFDDTLGYGYLVRSVQAVDVDNDGDLDIVHSYGGIYVNINTSPPVSVNDEISLPQELNLEQNFPNPFNPTTVISFQLPVSSSVSLKIYNVLGQQIATLVNETKTAGRYEIEWDASNFASGVYFYRLTTAQGTITRKLVLIK